MTNKAEQPTITQAGLIERLGKLLSELDEVLMTDTERAEAIVDDYERHRTTSLAAQEYGKVHTDGSRSGGQPPKAAQDGLVEALCHIAQLVDDKPIPERMLKPSVVAKIRATLSTIKGDKS